VSTLDFITYVHVHIHISAVPLHLFPDLHTNQLTPYLSSDPSHTISPQVGAAFPIWGLLLASVEDIFYYTDVQALRDASVTVAIRFILLGICCLIGYVLQYYCIAQVGQRISTGGCW
jgi:hypothetical protein